VATATEWLGMDGGGVGAAEDDGEDGVGEAVAGGVGEEEDPAEMVNWYWMGQLKSVLSHTMTTYM